MLGFPAYARSRPRQGRGRHSSLRDGAAVVLIDPVSLGYMAGSEIDFVDDLIGASFKVNNPKATASCGCGTSFTV